MCSRDESKTPNWAGRYPRGLPTSSGDFWAAQNALGSVEQVEWREYAPRDGMGQQALWRSQFVRRKGFSLHSYDVATPPCIFRRFTPDGRFLLALDRCGTDLLLFPYKRWACELNNGSNSKIEKHLSLSETGSASRPTVNDGRTGTFGDFFGHPLRISVINAYTVGVLAQQRAPALHTEAHGRGGWTLSATYLRDLVLCTPSARFVILGAWSAPQTLAREANSEEQVQPLLPATNPSEQSNSRHQVIGEGQRHAEAPPDLGAPQPTERRAIDIGTAAALPGCPLVPAVYLFLVDLEVQRVTDVFTLRDDMVNFDGQTGVQLFGTDLLLVTSLARQTVHLLRIRETSCDRGYVEGAFQHLASFGPHCYPDDALLIAKQYRRERDFRRQGRRVFPFQLSDLQQAEDSCPDSDSLGHNESMTFGSADRASTPAPAGDEEPTPGMTSSSEPVSTEGLNAIPEQRVPKRRRFRRRVYAGYDSERESSPFVMPCTTAAAVAGTAMAAAAFRMAYRALAKECFFTGIKQRLLAFLFRKHIQGNMHHYGRFASSFETLRMLIIQRAALIAEGRVLLRMVPAPHVLRAFTGSVATSLLHQPWYVSGISVAGLADSDLALVHATEARMNATADTLSSWPDSVPPSAQVAGPPVSKRRSDPMTELITQLRATLYVIYNYKNCSD
ncbi:hypothetical protein F1559_002703 [Cyanidiococcus yangmingshanensis]|uniref:Uncharacterized protein n=1 Tax=Cyanidiococcus yangmingshanensis TaxID=2690220 RepID=A0A7J7IJN5_9RHOD|nr:hypothetical protein F1559_002703 [Cyanidiococcus yangmingshanensis]